METKIKFKDKDKQLVTIDIKLEDGKFSMSGECGGSSGQMYDSIKPDNKDQERLVEIWKKYHLNDMNAGTPEQEEALKDFTSGDYEGQIDFLKRKGLHIVTLEDGSKYEYGTKWLSRNLPDDLEKEVLKLCKLIEAQEIEKKDKVAGGKWEDIDDDKVIALAKHLEITPNEAEEEIANSYGETYAYAGIDYFVGDDNETRQEAETYLTDDTYIYQSWVEEQIKNDNAENVMNIKDWAEWVINTDGYGSILNGYDGSEYNEDVNEITYYIIRR